MPPDRPVLRAHAPPAWTPPAPEMRELREMVRRCAALKAHRTQEINRQKAGLTSRVVATSIERLLTYIEQELRTITAAIRTLIARHSALQNNFDLLCSIPSIGEVTAALVLAELPNIAEFTPKGLAAFAGLSPQEHSSGTRRHTRQHQPHRQPRPAQHPLSLRSQRPAPQSAPRRFRATPDPGWKTSQGRPHRPSPASCWSWHTPSSEPKNRSRRLDHIPADTDPAISPARGQSTPKPIDTQHGIFGGSRAEPWPSLSPAGQGFRASAGPGRH